MEDMEFLGYLITGLGVIIAFVSSVTKVGNQFTQPINELRIVIQKLNDSIDAIKEDSISQSRRLDRHGDHIDKLDNRIGKLEVKMDIFHGKDDGKINE